MTAVSFSPFDAGRIANAVKWVERRAPSTATGEPIPWNDGGNEGLYGTAAADWTNGATISLTPCDVEGTATGESAVTVNVIPDGTSVSITTATVGGVGSVSVGCKIASGTLLAYGIAADGSKVLLGVPPTQFTYDEKMTATGVQRKVAFLVGLQVSTVSDWLPVYALSIALSGAALKLQFTPNGGAATDLSSIDTTESLVTPCTAPGG